MCHLAFDLALEFGSTREDNINAVNWSMVKKYVTHISDIAYKYYKN